MDTKTTYVTVDTNLYQDPVIIELGRGLPYLHIYATKITEDEAGREVIMGSQVGSWMWGEHMWGDNPFVPNKALPRVFTIGSSTIGGEDRIAPDGKGTDFLQAILDITTTGSVKYLRDLHSPHHGILNSINDAKILQIHCIHNFHIFVSNDTKFIGKPGTPKRHQLEQLSGTRIMTADEFKAIYLAHIPST